MSGGIPEGKHLEIRTPAAWGQGERGAEGYNDSGGSELVMRDGQLLGLMRLEFDVDLIARLRSLRYYGGLPLDARTVTDEVIRQEGK